MEEKYEGKAHKDSGNQNSKVKTINKLYFENKYFFFLVPGVSVFSESRLTLMMSHWMSLWPELRPLPRDKEQDRGQD